MSVKIRYIGKQPRKQGNAVIPDSKLVWRGHGDILEVSDKDADVFLNPNYSAIWERVQDAPPPAKADPGASGDASGQQPVDPAKDDEDEDEADAGASDAVTTEQVRERLTQIITAIPKLTKADFDNKGRPKLSALTAVLGRPVTKVERDAAWDAVLKHSHTQKEDAADDADDADQKSASETAPE